MIVKFYKERWAAVAWRHAGNRMTLSIESWLKFWCAGHCKDCAQCSERKAVPYGSHRRGSKQYVLFAGLNPFYQRLRWQSYSKFFALLVQRDLRKRELAIIQLVNNNREMDWKLSQEWEQIQRERPVSLKNLANQLLAAATYQPAPAKPTQPVLLLNAKGDRLVAPSCSETIQKKWHLELRTHPWAGHDLTLDDGAWVALQLKDWVAQKK